MEEAIAEPARAYGVRGNIFSFLLPWDTIQKRIADVVAGGDLDDWPLAPQKVKHLVRVRLVLGPESLLNKFKELAVRAYVIRDVARIYIENNIEGLQNCEKIQAIHEKMKKATVKDSLLAHAATRIVTLFCPPIHALDS